MSEEFDGFNVNLFQDADGEFIAHFVELPNVSACGDSAEEVIAELKEAWAAMKESYCKHNQEIPMPYNSK